MTARRSRLVRANRRAGTVAGLSDSGRLLSPASPTSGASMGEWVEAVSRRATIQATVKACFGILDGVQITVKPSDRTRFAI